MPMIRQGARQATRPADPDAPFYVYYWCHRTRQWTEAPGKERDHSSDATSEADDSTARTRRAVRVFDAAGKSRHPRT
ncbi:hypothetical protein OY671_009778 [Metschnikowia pulcherrima]|nr:hypothetical protein OY671_009778 [Metschnikowia pulcherrima]